MNKPYKYKAFLTYAHKDKKFVRWLHRGIENYAISKILHEKYPHLPINLKRSIFRDDEELGGASVLSAVLKKALETSQYLIVICSPDALSSAWVEEEIRYFIKVHGKSNIITVVHRGEPEEVIPNILREKNEPLAVDARSANRKALFKVLASILEVYFSDVWERDKREQKKRMGIKLVLGTLLLGLVFSVYVLSTSISSNDTLTQIDQEIAAIVHKQNRDMNKEKAYILSEDLHRLRELKKAKIDTLKWFGMLKTSVAKQAKEVYDKKGAKEALIVLESSKSLYEDEVYAKKNMLRAKLYVEQDDIVSATNSYEKAIAIDDTYINSYDYALFLMKQRKFTRAKALYENLSKDDLLAVQKANVLNRLGILYRKTNKLKLAEKVYSEALVLRTILANENPQKYNNDLAWTYNNLGVLYKESNKPNASEQSYMKAFTLRKELMELEPKKYRYYVSCSMHNLGELYRTIKRDSEAEEYLFKALNIRKALAINNPKKYNYAYAWTLYELAELYSTKRQYTKAESYFNKSLKISSDLVLKNHDAYVEVYDNATKGLKILNSKMKEFSDAT